MNWQNETPFFLKTRKRKCTSLHQFTLACSAGAKLSSSTGALGPGSQLSVKGCVEVKNVSSDSGVCTPEEHFPKLSPFSAPPGIGGELQKSVSVQACRGAGDGMGGWDLWWEFSSETLKIWNREKNRKEKERERERIFWHWSSTQRLWLWGEIWSGAQRIMLVCSRSQVIVERMCKSTHCSTFAQAEAFSERKGFTIRLKKPTLCVSTV